MKRLAEDVSRWRGAFYVNPLLFLGAYFVFFSLTVFSITVFAVCSAVTFAFVICSNNKERVQSNMLNSSRLHWMD